MNFLVAQFLTGLANASSLFLVASGLSIIFGVTRIVNFAHGSFYMLGAYLAYTLVGKYMATMGATGFWVGVLLAALAVGVLGAVMEFALLRRLYRSPELFQLLATFGVVLVVQDLVLHFWGPEDLLGPRAPGFAGSIEILGIRLPEYDFFLIVMGPLVLATLWLLFHTTRWGLLVRAATEDREMLAALGVRQKLLFTSVVFLGAALAGLGGALQLPREPANLLMDMNVIVEAFVVVVVGGMGSLPGAFLAALLIGLLEAFGILIFPKITLVLLFLVMAVVLMLRPQGLLGRRERIADRPQDTGPPVMLPRVVLMLALLAALAVLGLLPFVAGDFVLALASEILIFALFAASLQFLMGLGGMISFGHAAYLGLGAYGSALVVKHFAVPMEGALLVAPFAAGLGAVVFGWFSVRLSGVYLAMLTLAFAQIGWSVAFQWVEITGGDNGILGVWPSPWAKPPVIFYGLTLAIVLPCLAILRRVGHAPFGYTLRATRDAPLRAAAIGIDLRGHRWASFILAGIFAGLAGGLYAFLKGSVFPDVMAIPTSIDALVMVLLGGVNTVNGPLVGAAIYDGLRAELVGLTELWRLFIGLLIIGMVLLFPQGILGSISRLLEFRR
jgi:branched-chain amino acid transport system permease protein